MELRSIDATLAVAPQMAPEELAGLAAQGFAAVICNRPDGEEPGQPPLDEMRRAAQEAGLAFHHIPVAGGLFPPAAVAASARSGAAPMARCWPIAAPARARRRSTRSPMSAP